MQAYSPDISNLLSSTRATMAHYMRACMATVLSFVIASSAFMTGIEAAGACGRTPIGAAAASLSPCLGAARNVRAAVPGACCAKVGGLIRTSPRCLCAVLLSPLAKRAGIRPGIAITIPKRCRIKNRPVGKKCGRYTVP